MKTKVVYRVYSMWFGEMQFFFDAKHNLLHYWACNDANWRAEYMDPLMKALGFKMEGAEETDPRFAEKIKEVLRELGASEEDFE